MKAGYQVLLKIKYVKKIYETVYHIDLHNSNCNLFDCPTKYSGVEHYNSENYKIIIFPAMIIHTDIGTADILVQKVEQATNILLIKAGRKDFEQTNLSVITADGNVYSLIVNYDSSQASFIYNITQLTPVHHIKCHWGMPCYRSLLLKPMQRNIG